MNLKSQKLERYRRQKIRDFNNTQKQLMEELDIWKLRLKHCSLQVKYYTILLKNRKPSYGNKAN